MCDASRVHLARALLLLAAPLACIREPAPTPRRPSPAAPSPPPIAPAPPAPPVAPTPAPPVVDQQAAPVPVRFVVRVSGGARPGDRLPLLVALHGLGDSPENFIGLYTEMGLRVRVAAAAGLDRYGDGYSWFPSRAEVPTEQWVEGIRRAADAVVPAVRRLAQENPTCGLPIVSGFSQGGMLSYAIVARPDAGVSAALPLGGLLPRALFPEARAVGGLLPAVYAFHGTADERVPFAMDRAANDAFRDAGFPAELREYPGVGHSIPPAMQADLRRRLETLLASSGCAP